jgi:hypothetical protein
MFTVTITVVRPGIPIVVIIIIITRPMSAFPRIGSTPLHANILLLYNNNIIRSQHRPGTVVPVFADSEMAEWRNGGSRWSLALAAAGYSTWTDPRTGGYRGHRRTVSFLPFFCLQRV